MKKRTNKPTFLADENTTQRGSVRLTNLHPSGMLAEDVKCLAKAKQRAEEVTTEAIQRYEKCHPLINKPLKDDFAKCGDGSLVQSS